MIADLTPLSNSETDVLYGPVFIFTHFLHEDMQVAKIANELPFRPILPVVAEFAFYIVHFH